MHFLCFLSKVFLLWRQLVKMNVSAYFFAGDLKPKTFYTVWLLPALEGLLPAAVSEWAFFLSRLAKNPASRVPEIECHTQDTAQITADSGDAENWAEVVARLVASPAFCIPTSMDIVLFFAVFIPVRRPAPYPNRYPKPL